MSPAAGKIRWILIVSLLLSHHVRDVLFIFIADKFENLGPKLQMHSLRRGGPGLGVGFGVVDGRPHFHVSKVGAPPALRYMQSLGSRVALLRVQPSLVVEAGCFYHQRVALPLSRRVTQPGGVDIL